jgi:serine protease Do
MSSQTRKISRLIIVTLLTVAVITGALTWPDLLSRVTYAIERGQAGASQEQLALASDLSEAFQHVSRVLRPSVVSVSSVKRVQVSEPQVRRFDSQMPDEFRRFFGGDDLLDRFFFDIPSAPRGFEQHGLGSGVIVSSDGYILTNNHVVQGADEVTVTLSDNRQLDAEVVGTDKATDVAVLKVVSNGLHPAKLGDSSNLQVGQWALAMGSPFGLDQTVTAGIVSAVGRANVGITDYEDFIQTDAAINPGNSGGPLVNLRGEVIGINTAIASRNGGYQGVGFAIPINLARHVMESIIDHGAVTRGFVGALVQDLNEDLAQSFGFDSSEGVLIGDVVDGGPAAKAGLQAGDIVTSYRDKKVTSAAQLRNAVAATEPDTRAAVEFYRHGEAKTVTVTVGKLDEKKTVTAGRIGAAATGQLGMTVEELTPELAQQLGVDRDERGVVVTDVERSGLAARGGIRPGDIIMSFGGTRIASLADFREALRDHDPTLGVRLQVQRDGVRRFIFLRG